MSGGGAEATLRTASVGGTGVENDVGLAEGQCREAGGDYAEPGQVRWILILDSILDKFIFFYYWYMVYIGKEGTLNEYHIININRMFLICLLCAGVLRDLVLWLLSGQQQIESSLKG